MPDREIKLIIKADGTAAISGIKDVENAAGGMGTSLKNLAIVAAATTAATLALKAGFDQVVASATLAARIETMGVVLSVVGRNAGYSQEQLRGYVESTKSLGITTSASLDVLTRSAQAHIQLADSLKLSRIAQDAAVIGMVNSSEANQTLIHGIQSGQTDVLRTIGINVNFEQSYAQLAQTLGKSTDALTEQEKMQARVNAVVDSGKMIAGTYEAAMGTAGKQALSLARYSEEAQLKLGELFKPAYGAIVKIATDSLKGLNDTLAEMAANGDLAKWGERLAAAVTLIGKNAVPIAMGALTALGVTVASLTTSFTVLSVAAKAAFIGSGIGAAITIGAAGGLALGNYLESLQPENKRRAQQQKDFKEEEEFQAAHWKKIQAQLDDSGIKGIQSSRALVNALNAGDIEKYTVDIGGKIETRFKDVRNAFIQTQAQIAATTKGFAEMAGVIDKMGGMNLKFAGDDFKKSISVQADDMRKLSVEYQNLSDTVKSGLDLNQQIARVGDLTSAFTKFGGTVDSVYKNQISKQRDILDEMKNYETNQKNVIKQAATITETEIKYNEAKLANYRSYYDELKKMQKGYYDAALKATQDIANIEKAKVGDKKQTGDLLYSMWDKANPAADEMQQYYRDASHLEQELNAAMTLSSEERVKALSDIQRQYAGLSKQITVGDNTYNTYDEVSKRIIAIGDAMAQARDQMIADAAATRDQALAAYASLVEPIKAVETEITNVQSTIMNLDNLLAQQRMLTIDVSGALSGLRMVADQMNAISGFSMQQITGNAAIGSSYAGSILSDSNMGGTNWDGSPQVTYIPAAASGMDYVPRDMPVYVHKGERILTAEQNKAGASAQPISISFGDIVIQGTNKDAKQLAREIIGPIREELRKLEARK